MADAAAARTDAQRPGFVSVELAALFDGARPDFFCVPLPRRQRAERAPLDVAVANGLLLCAPVRRVAERRLLHELHSCRSWICGGRLDRKSVGYGKSVD